MKRCAIIDDYQNCALDFGDWDTLKAEVEVVVFNDHVADEDAVAERLRDFEIVCIMRERTPFPRSMFEKLPKLELLLTSGMRNLSIDVAAARDHGVVVSGSPSQGYPTAELTWGLIHAWSRQIPLENRATLDGAWEKTIGIGLSGKTLGLAGLGRIGGAVAKVGLAFGMRVIAWSENLTDERCAEVGVERVDKATLVREADFLTIHLVLSDRTRGLFQAEDLAAMKSSACLINTSRGPIVDEAALIAALQNGTIAGAGLDVFDVEPLPLDHPFRSMENIVITPHLGYVIRENYAVYYGMAVENIRAYLDGAPQNELK